MPRGAAVWPMDLGEQWNQSKIQNDMGRPKQAIREGRKQAPRLQ